VKFNPQNPPREYEAGFEHKVNIHDCGEIELLADEQVTFSNEAGNEYDLARKSWGYYATPSINGRLKKFNFKTALAKNRLGYFFVLLVEEGKEQDFENYLRLEKMHLITWLNDEDSLKKIESVFSE